MQLEGGGNPNPDRKLAEGGEEKDDRVPFVVAAEGQGDMDEEEEMEGDDKAKQPPNLFETIQSHIQEENRRYMKESLVKESLIKCSVDKEFAYLFEESANKPLIGLKEEPVEDKLTLEVNREEEKICNWL